MNPGFLSAVLSGAAAITVAVLTYLLTKHKEREADWRKVKLDLYKEYVAALSSQLNDLTATQTRYVDAANALTLVAPLSVIKALYAFNDGLFVNQSGNLTDIIQALLGALRQDIHPSLRRNREDPGLRLFRKSAASNSEPRIPTESK
ncbi:MAG TPA: hypothetical protein VND19_10790 [Acetobacteraceae bacterium]|nr:hypothetical protein [Acetobacteraceae bacterium]